MKKIYVYFYAVMLMGSALSLSAQSDVHYDRNYGGTYDILLGVHSGFYDCNQNYANRLNLGFFGQYHYRPDIMDHVFFGIEAGAFYSKGGGSDFGEEFRDVYIGYASFFPGFMINLSRKRLSSKEQVKNNLYSRKLKLGAGVTYGMPFGYENKKIIREVDDAFPGFGITAMMSFDLSNRVSFLASVHRINADTDGTGFNEDDERVAGNLYDLTYWYRFGMTYNLVGN